MHAVHVLTFPRLHVLTFDKLLRGAHVVAVHAYEVHTGGHVAQVDTGVVVGQFNSLYHLAEGVVNHSFLHFHIAVQDQDAA